MYFRKDLLLTVQFIVQLIIAVCGGQESVAVRDKQIKYVHYLQRQMEYVALLDQRLFLVDQEPQKANQRRPEFLPWII